MIAAMMELEPKTAQAANLVIEEGKCSTSFIQRKLAIGYNRAARIVENLEALDIVSPCDHVGKRQVLATSIPEELTAAGRAQEDLERLTGFSMGASAKAIAHHLLGYQEPRNDHPHDASDFDRCEVLLDRADLWGELHRMAAVSPYWAALVPMWDAIRASKDKSAIIKSIIHPIQASDPKVIDMGGGVTMSIQGDDAFIAKVKKAHEGARRSEEKPPMTQVNDDWLGEPSAPTGGKALMRETDADRAVSDNVYRVAAEELRAFIERFERLEAEKKDITDSQKDVMAEAKGRGYDTKVLRKVIALRKRDKDDIAEEEAVLEMYKTALGMI